MSYSVTKGCNLKETCIHNEVCNFDKGEICEGKFICKKFENVEMFLNKLVNMCNVNKQ